MNVPGLSESLIEDRAERGSIERGKEYYDSGAVRTIRRLSDDAVEAFVQGSNVAPYRVAIRHDAERITSAECTCPYVTGSWCRHIVAALYAVMERAGTLSRPLSDMLGDFDRAELLRLVERIVADHPGSAAIVEQAYRQKQGS